jgi:hypothetical protein
MLITLYYGYSKTFRFQVVTMEEEGERPVCRCEECRSDKGEKGEEKRRKRFRKGGY